MSRLFGGLIMTGVAAALVTSSVVFAQVPKAATPRAPEAVKVEAKAVEVKADMVKVQRRAVVKARTQVKAVMPAVVNDEAAPGDAAADPQLQQFVQQFTQQLRPGLRAEYHLIKTVCEPTIDQRKELALAGERAFRDAVSKMAEFQRRMMRGIWNGQPTNVNPVKLIQEGMAAAVKASLSEAQRDRYQVEVGKRTANRKKVAVDNLVAKLDEDLVLNAEQRDKLSEWLYAHWNDAWCSSLDIFMNGGNQFVPNIPDQHVVPFLSETQKRVWRGIQKQQQVFWGWNNFIAGNMVMGGPEPMEDPDLAEARKNENQRLANQKKK